MQTSGQHALVTERQFGKLLVRPTPHTQRDSCDNERRFRLPGHDPSTLQSSAFYATSEASYVLTDLRLYSSSASCKRWYGYRFGSRSNHKDQFLRQCHLVTQASPEFKNFCQTIQLSAVIHVSQTTQANLSSTISQPL